MGTLVHGLTQIKFSWSAASDASQYRIVLGAGCLIAHDFPETREPLQESHVTLLEKQVTDSMKLGDLGKTKEAVGEFVAYVRLTSFDEMMLVFAQMLIVIVRVARTMGVADHEDARTYIGSLNQQLYMKESIEEIELLYMGLCEKQLSREINSRCRRTNGLSTKCSDIFMKATAIRA